MKNSQRSNLVRRLIILALLLACLGTFGLGLGGKKVFAAACCTDCDVALDDCNSNCGDPPYGPCLNFCERRYERCLSTCDPGC
jgi:hypothetical protein